MDTQTMMLIVCTSLGPIAIILWAISMYVQASIHKQEFEVKMAIAEAQSKSTSVAEFKKIRENIDFIISFFVAHEVSMEMNSARIDEDDYAEILEHLVVDISSRVRVTIPDETIRQLKTYISIEDEPGENDEYDFLSYYIRKTTTTMVLQVMKNKGSR